MLFGFRNKEFEHLLRNLAIFRQKIDERSTLRKNLRNGFGVRRVIVGGVLRGELRRGGRKRKAVALLERRNVTGSFSSVGRDLQQIELEHGDGIRQKFSERAVGIGSERGVHRVLENMCELARDFGEQRKAVACRRSAHGVRCDVEALEIFGARLGLLDKAGVFPQILQVIGRFLQEELERCVFGFAHRLPSATTAWRSARSLAGLR